VTVLAGPQPAASQQLLIRLASFQPEAFAARQKHLLRVIFAALRVVCALKSLGEKAQNPFVPQIDLLFVVDSRLLLCRCSYFSDAFLPIG
jgi:hypothetical protein